MVSDLADRVLVLDYGVKIADGSSDEIKRNRDVIAAYLGQDAPAPDESADSLVT
jgi:branched-chain amino acid transport system ATP-binding protein